MVELTFDKLYRYDRIGEPCGIGLPVKEGELPAKDVSRVCVLQNGKRLPVQTKITSRHKDGSVRFLFLRFLADLRGNQKEVVQCDLGGENGDLEMRDYAPVCVEPLEGGFMVSTVCDGTDMPFRFCVEHHSGHIIESLEAMGRHYQKEQFAGPFLKDGEGNAYEMQIGEWKIVEEGPVCAVLKAGGSNLSPEKKVDFELKLTAWAGKPWVEVSYRVINTTKEPLHVASLVFSLTREAGLVPGSRLVPMQFRQKLDSTGCGDLVEPAEYGDGPVYHARGHIEADEVMGLAPLEGVRTCVGSSNYKTDFLVGRDGSAVNKVVDASFLMREANEHYAEVFYGTFLADCTDERGGVCATVFQAQQNYPKAVQADQNGITVYLVPEDVEKIVMQMGMSREQRFLLHFHDAGTKLSAINDRSLIYQMPDRPYAAPAVHAESGVYPNVFAPRFTPEVEQNLIGRADAHCRAYGMLNFGDSYDGGYTAQGRGGGDLVWCNNEYDYPHACALLYVRTGIRRFLDYNIASCSHWMDVDVCHYHTNPLYIGGQWEHTGGHCVNGIMVCSHEWVEGLLDYYHFTGDERGYQTAIGIGENVLGLLKTPMYAQVGEATARETGWALRTLTALYVETRDERWLAPCAKILEDFKLWEKEYGNWLSPYTDNTVIRVGFMISVAIGSVMRYYREFPDEALKGMMLRAVDDIVENCYVKEWDLFYYKELPSLNRLGKNTLLLEALTIAYELSGDASYLEKGIGTFKAAMGEGFSGAVGSKRVVGDALVVGTASSKIFAQSMIPLSCFYRAACECGLL